MKEAIVAKGPKVTVQDVPIPKPNADQVIYRFYMISSYSIIKHLMLKYSTYILTGTN